MNIFNRCLDNPSPLWEMEGLKTHQSRDFLRSQVQWVLKDPTSVVPSPVVLEDPNPVVYRAAQFHDCCHNQEGRLCLSPHGCSACMGQSRSPQGLLQSQLQLGVHPRACSRLRVHSRAHFSL
ncbi:hypothetical protein QQF64_008239 [Cirrhinus molitorella]|uniref:Uncharacterized protein n=1 Tax=Cirrhinus molitorella TaxID=172907 RepID=A0ABR3M927_9TELE